VREMDKPFGVREMEGDGETRVREMEKLG